MTAVIASETAMTAVIASETAMTAVIASSTAMTAVAASETALNAIGINTTAMSAMMASATAVTTLDSGNKTIPTMTSNTTPSGVCSAPNINPTYPAWKAFNKSTADQCIFGVGNVANSWIAYTFPKRTFVYKCDFYCKSVDTCVKDYKVEYSENGSTWVVAKSGTRDNSAGFTEIFLEKSISAMYWRLSVSSNYGANDVHVFELEMYGREFE